MASTERLCFLFVCFFALGKAKYCLKSSDCSALESCRADNVCRQRCHYCSYDHQCGTSEQCCDNKCISSSSSCFCANKYECGLGKKCCKKNASVNRLLVLVRMTSNVALERNVVGECVRQTVVWAAELLQALSSAILSSSPSSFALYPASAVLPARITVIVHPVMWSSPNSRNNSSSQLRHTRWRRSKYKLLCCITTTSPLQQVTTSLLQVYIKHHPLIRHLFQTWILQLR